MQHTTSAEEHTGEHTTRHNQCKGGCTGGQHPARIHVTHPDPQPHNHPAPTPGAAPTATAPNCAQERSSRAPAGPPSPPAPGHHPISNGMRAPASPCPARVRQSIQCRGHESPACPPTSIHLQGGPAAQPHHPDRSGHPNPPPPPPSEEDDGAPIAKPSRTANRRPPPVKTPQPHSV